MRHEPSDPPYCDHAGGIRRGDVVHIPLRGADGQPRAWAIVDAADYPGLAATRWCLHTHGYPIRNRSRRQGRGNVLMHRQLYSLTPGDSREVDHINGDPRDNRRANLRVVTHAQNGQNVPARNGHRGVRRDRRRPGTWEVLHGLNGRNAYGGYFKSEEEAAVAAAMWRAEHMPFATG